MDVVTVTVAGASYGLIGVILYRGGRAQLLREYPLFFAYLSYVFLSSLVLFRLLSVSREIYFYGYWTAEFVSALFGTGVVWEAYNTALAGYPGVRRMTRVSIFLLVLAVSVKFAADLAARPITVLFPTIVELEQNLRFVQAILLLAILALLGYYRVPLNRNVRYLLFGYSLYVGAVVITLTLQSVVGTGFLNWYRALQQSAYVVALAIWCAGLWRKSASPALSPTLERDYRHISHETARAVARIRTRFAEALKS